MPAYITLNDMPVALDTSVTRTARVQRIQLGDGYSQILTDGLNAQLESWRCKTGPLTEEDAYGIESYLLRKKGQAFDWTPPNASKAFTAQFESGILDLGFTKLSSLLLAGYTRPTNYTANLATGVLSSVTIPNFSNVSVSLVLAPRSYVLDDGWQFDFISCSYYSLSFTLTQIYV